jgi:hypothetical protein
MSVIERGQPIGSPSARWGWGIVATLSALLVANAVWLFAAAGTSGLFEADTGVSASAFRDAYPTVADELAGRGRTIAVLLAGLAALALAVAIAGMRGGADWARRALWVFVAALALVATNAFVGGRADVGSFYVASAGVAAFGVFLTGRRTAA